MIFLVFPFCSLAGGRRQKNQSQGMGRTVSANAAQIVFIPPSSRTESSHHHDAPTERARRRRVAEDPTNKMPDIHRRARAGGWLLAMASEIGSAGRRPLCRIHEIGARLHLGGGRGDIKVGGWLTKWYRSSCVLDTSEATPEPAWKTSDGCLPPVLTHTSLG